MKYKFMKLLLDGGITPPPTGGVLTITKPYINLNDIERQTRLNDWQTKASLDWMTNGQYDYAKMYAYYQQHPEEFGDISSITATPNFEGAKTNDRGYLQWNLQFNQTGLNKFFGYDESVADYYGPTTAARAGFINYINNQTPPETIPEVPPVVPPVVPPETPPETPPAEPPIPGKPEPTPWTDWIPLSGQLGNDLAAIEKLADLQKQMRFPLMEGPFKQKKVTNNYHLRTGMLQNANELRDLAAFRSNSSDMQTNLNNMALYDAQAAGIENLAELEKSRKYAEDMLAAENVTNENKETLADVANFNNNSNVSAWNNILNANARRSAARNQALNSYIGNMYTSHGQWLQDQRVNDNMYLRGLNEYMASLEQLKAYKDVSNLEDPYKSKAFADFRLALNQPGGANSIEGFNSERWSNDQDAYIKELWEGDYNISRQYRNKYAEEKNTALLQYYDKYQQIANRLLAANLVIPTKVSNQGIYINRDIHSTYSPLFSDISYNAKGGKVRSRFIDYINHLQKEQQDVRRTQHKRNELSIRKLNADLDRLSKEQLILLRSVFK